MQHFGWMNDEDSKCNKWRLPRFYGIRTLRVERFVCNESFPGQSIGRQLLHECMELGLEMLNTLGWKPGLVIYWATGFSHHCLRPLIIHQTLSRVMARGYALSYDNCCICLFVEWGCSKKDCMYNFGRSNV